ncbi:MAG: hypothetical protein WDZ72_09540 [Cyclobacteriaceae bacterium]
MSKKLFPLDKNYILHQAQNAIEEELMLIMVEELKNSFRSLFNPLGLQDDTYLKILNNNDFPSENLKLIYHQLAGIYRFKFGSNQLELLFDGRSHFEKYQEDWARQLKIWLIELGMHGTYVKTMLRITLLYDSRSRALFSENRCKSFINEYFQLQIIKRKGNLLLKTGS